MTKTKHEIYWENRMANSQELADKTVSMRMKKMYQDAYKQLNREIEKIWMEMLEKGEISQTALYQVNRYRSLQQNLDKQMRLLANEQISKTQLSLIDTYIDNWNAINDFAGISKEWTVMNEHTAKQVVMQEYKGATFSERVWDDMSTLKAQINTAIINTTVLGKDVRKASRALQERLNVGYNSCKRITITETSRVFNESCRVSALETGLYKTYHILLEHNACDRCTPYADKHFDLSESILPIHPYCKCTTIIDIDIDKKKDDIYIDGLITNKHGDVIQIEPGFKNEAKLREVLAKLTSEYDTELRSVGPGSKGAAGHVDLSFAMKINNTKTQLIYHEFAHSLAIEKADKYGLTNNQQFWKEIRKVRTQYKKAVSQDPSKRITGYADDSIDEFMAESFAHAKLINTGELGIEFGDDTTFSQQILAIIDKYFKKT